MAANTRPLRSVVLHTRGWLWFACNAERKGPSRPSGTSRIEPCRCQSGTQREASRSLIGAIQGSPQSYRVRRVVETLAGTCVRALDGDDTAANELIDSAPRAESCMDRRHRFCDACVSSRAPPASHSQTGGVGVNHGQESKRP